MATPEQINDITALYVGYFNRAPDPAGLQFWIDQIDGGREFNTIAEDFAGSPEAQALYPYLVTPGVSTPTAFITSVYVNLFNRAPDADGLAFWTGVLEEGSVSVADMIEAIINGAQDDAVAGTYDATTLNNKIEVGQYFAENAANIPGFNYNTAAAAAAVEALNGVTEDSATVVDGKVEVNEFLNPQIALDRAFVAAQAAYEDAAATAAASQDAADAAQAAADAAQAAVIDLATAEAYQAAAEAAQDAAATAAADAAAEAAEAEAAAAAAAATANTDDDVTAAANTAAAAAAVAAAAAAQDAASADVVSANAQVDAYTEQVALDSAFAAAQAAYEDAAATAAASQDAADAAQAAADAAQAAVIDLATAEAYQAAAEAAQDAATAAAADAAAEAAEAEAAAAAAAATANTDDDVTAAANTAAAAAAVAAAAAAQDAASAEVVSANAQVDAYTGQAFTLTTGTDSGAAFTGNNADTTFLAPLESAIDGLFGAQTLQSFDVLDGGPGFNTLNAELNGTGVGANPTITNVQKYNLTSTSVLPLVPGLTGSLDLDRASGYEQLWNVNSRVDLELTNVGEVAALGMLNVRDGSTYAVNYDNIAVETQVVFADHAGRPGDRVELEINGVQGQIGSLELNVSNDTYLRLDNDAAEIANLSIAGDGILDLVGEDDFDQLESLDASGYNEALTLDISGSGVLTNVLTGDFDDVITVSAATFSNATPATALDLGLGNNRLILEDTVNVGVYTGGGLIDDAELSALTFARASVSNVQTLELVDVDLDGDASLSLAGVGGLETLELRDLEVDGHDLFISGAPAVLTISGISSNPNGADFDMEGGFLTVNGVVDLTMSAVDDVRVDGGLQGSTMETFIMNAGDEAELDISGGLQNLVSIEVNALGTSPSLGGNGSNADVDIKDIGATGMESLATVTVNAVNDADLNMNGANAALAGAEADLAGALTDQVAADAALIAADADEATAAADLIAAELVQSNAFLTQALAEQDRDDEQADVDAAVIVANGTEAAALATQATLDAANATYLAGQAALTAVQTELAADIAYMASSPFTTGFGNGLGNISAVQNYILANSEFTTPQKNALLALIPTGGVLGSDFDSNGERTGFLTAANTALTTLSGEAALIAQDVLNANAVTAAIAADNAADALDVSAQADLLLQQGELAAAQLVLDGANTALTAADALVATETADLLAAQTAAIDAAEAAADAQLAVNAAESAVTNALDDGTGFEALDHVVVNAGDDADVDMTDVYGDFTLDVTAVDDANVTLTNTNVTSATVTAYDTTILITGSATTYPLLGDSVGNPLLVDLTVSGHTADVTLDGGLDSFTTLNVTGVTTDLTVDTSGADFVVGAGQFIDYQIGTTTNVDFTGNLDAREVYDFTSGNIGSVEITNFTEGADPLFGDRLDLSDYANGAGQLVFSQVGGDVVITDIVGGVGDFDGSITIVGAVAADLAFNILYA